MNGIAIPTLRTARLVLRRPMAEDHPDFLALAADAEVARYMNEGPAPTPAEVWQRMAAALGQWGLRGYGMMAVEDAAGFIGRVGFFHPFGQPEPLLVYALARRAWGQGYATEAVAAARDWMFAEHGPGRLLSHVMPANAASARIAAKLGATCIGGLDQRGVRLDVWCYLAPA
jgi:RimJ/RimL family protein N-acetyltransferase